MGGAYDNIEFLQNYIIKIAIQTINSLGKFSGNW